LGLKKIVVKIIVNLIATILFIYVFIIVPYLLVYDSHSIFIYPFIGILTLSLLGFLIYVIYSIWEWME